MVVTSRPHIGRMTKNEIVNEREVCIVLVVNTMSKPGKYDLVAIAEDYISPHSIALRDDAPLSIPSVA